MAVFPAFFGLLMAVLASGQEVEVSPTYAVRRVGEDLTITVRVGYKIDFCQIFLGSSDPVRLDPNDTRGDIVYSGEGFNAGVCGAHIKQIREEWNGDVKIIVSSPPPSSSETIKKDIIAKMTLVVAKAPETMELIPPQQPSFMEGDLFNAVCAVANARPVANITWRLNGREVSGYHVANITREGEFESITQIFTRTLTADDDGATLECVAEHRALDHPWARSVQLHVKYGPKRLESGPITIFGLKLGTEERLNVTVRSNPEPTATWAVGNVRLRAPMSSNDGTLTALRPVLLGNGYYNLTLVLHKVAKEDVDKTYQLHLENEHGEEEITVRISTMDEPQDLSLGAGAITGIIIAVLILLIAVSLLVFAKATNRWCFEGTGRAREHVRNSGESDTESAVGGRERSRLPAGLSSGLSGLTARMRAVLPKAKDKVQATEAAAAETEERPLSEEKKGVVYAELVLSEQPKVEKPAQPATEYAEIVYSEQPAQKETKE